MKKYIDDKSYEYPTKYRLLGISTHLGKTGQYGHYISFCLCDDNEYYCLNDSFVTKLQHNETYKLYEGSPYILFYQRIEKTNKANINEIIINIKNNIKSIIQEINFKKDDIHLFLENEKRIDRKEIIYKEKNNKLIFKLDYSEFTEYSKKLNLKFVFKKNEQDNDNLSYIIITQYYLNKKISFKKNEENIKKIIINCFDNYKKKIIAYFFNNYKNFLFNFIN